MAGTDMNVDGPSSTNLGQRKHSSKAGVSASTAQASKGSRKDRTAAANTTTVVKRYQSMANNARNIVPPPHDPPSCVNIRSPEPQLDYADLADCSKSAVNVKNLLKIRAPPVQPALSYRDNLLTRAWFPVDEQDTSSSDDSLVFTQRSGGAISPDGCYFSIDSNVYTVPGVQKIFSFTVNDNITAICMHPLNANWVFVAMADGFIGLYNFLNGQLHHAFNIDSAAIKMVMTANDPDSLYIWAMSFRKKVRGSAIEQVAELPNAISHTNTIMRLYLPDSTPTLAVGHTFFGYKQINDMDVTASGTMLVVLVNRCIYFWNLEDMQWPPMNYLQKGGNRTLMPQPATHYLNAPSSVLALHPTQPVVAVGYRTGPVGVYQLSFHQSEPEVRQLTRTQWHVAEVQTLRFTGDGLHLLSGGMEGVILSTTWQDGKMRFLPRMAAPIRSLHLASDQQHMALALANGSVHVSATDRRRVLGSVVGLRHQLGLTPAVRTRPLRGCFTTHPTTQNIVLPTVFSSLQFYDPFTDQSVADLPLAALSSYTGDPFSSGHPTSVANLQFSADGQWLALYVQVASSEQGKLSHQLLFYRYNRRTKQYDGPNTRIIEPHPSPIVTMEFQSHYPTTSPQAEESAAQQAPLLVTSAAEGKVKIWQCCSRQSVRENQQGQAIHDASQVTTTLYWANRSTCSFHEDANPRATFSYDGSLLVIAHGNTISLWNPYTNTMQRSFALPNVTVITRVHFAGPSPFLVVQSPHHLAVWNVLTGTEWWSHHMDMNDRLITFHPNAPFFATITEVTTGKTGKKGKKANSHSHHHHHNHSAKQKSGLKHQAVGLLQVFHVDSPVPMFTRALRNRMVGLTFVGRRWTEADSQGQASRSQIFPWTDRSHDAGALTLHQETCQEEVGQFSLVTLSQAGELLTFTPRANSIAPPVHASARRPRLALSRISLANKCDGQPLPVSAAQQAINDRAANPERSLFSLVYGNLQTQALSEADDRMKSAQNDYYVTGSHMASGHKVGLTGDTASHLLPPMQSLFNSLMNTSIPKVKATQYLGVSGGADGDQSDFPDMYEEEASNEGGSLAQANGANRGSASMGQQSAQVPLAAHSAAAVPSALQLLQPGMANGSVTSVQSTESTRTGLLSITNLFTQPASSSIKKPQVDEESDVTQIPTGLLNSLMDHFQAKLQLN
ncbi:NET1-associated nuclear protein 1 [Dimargaris cristalligena]|nr:NET1-associated nuclear protein 1 [Dimargaris cristalligena]